jgi:hypothetical protein
VRFQFSLVAVFAAIFFNLEQLPVVILAGGLATRLRPITEKAFLGASTGFAA